MYLHTVSVVTRTGLRIPGGVGQGIYREGAWVLCSYNWSFWKWSYTRFAVLQLYSFCFCHLRSLVIMILRSYCSSVACCCDQYALLHICQHWSHLPFIRPVNSLLRSSWNSRTSSGWLERWESFASSENSDTLFTIIFSRSLMYMRKRSSSSSGSSSVKDRPLGPFPAKHWPTTVCTHLNCAGYRWLLIVNTNNLFWGIFCPAVFVDQAVLERVHSSAAYNFTW